jgi:hypothetical protein
LSIKTLSYAPDKTSFETSFETPFEDYKHPDILIFLFLGTFPFFSRETTLRNNKNAESKKFINHSMSSFIQWRMMRGT